MTMPDLTVRQGVAETQENCAAEDVFDKRKSSEPVVLSDATPVSETRLPSEALVLRVSESGWRSLATLFAEAGLTIEPVPPGSPIPGSHWGDDEAGLIGHTLYARPDTPVHSVLHEGCHWLLMDEQRRHNLHTDAKGSAVEEMAVCYLQVLLSDLLPEMGRRRMFLDMDRWGYSFRAGSSRAWFEQDAEDALAYLTDKLSHAHGIRGLQIV